MSLTLKADAVAVSAHRASLVLKPMLRLRLKLVLKLPQHASSPLKAEADFVAVSEVKTAAAGAANR
jgi:hypothetical protein